MPDPHPLVLILDASCLLNLYATGRFGEILVVSLYRFAVADYVLDEEALFTLVRESFDGPLERAPVDLRPFIEDGLVEVMSVESTEEIATFVDLAIQIDDGEAITASLAAHRGCAVATDDRKARRVIAEQAPTVPLVSTLDLLSEWAEASQMSMSELKSVFAAMQTGASYVPGRRDPRFDWWVEVMQEEV
ncbi:hypothetical protein F4Y93_10775 [Candidatus Poribacteria bacterium]|nr:hypothetical protein [Candidatus Poribacteria bacterium]MYF23335.1 hypothetical protein [Chloroflexota bacterium]